MWLEKEVWASTLCRPCGGAFSVRATPAYVQSDKEAMIFPENTQEGCRIVSYMIYLISLSVQQTITKHGCLKAVRMNVPEPLALGSSSSLVCKIAL